MIHLLNLQAFAEDYTQVNTNYSFRRVSKKSFRIADNPNYSGGGWYQRYFGKIVRLIANRDGGYPGDLGNYIATVSVAEEAKIFAGNVYYTTNTFEIPYELLEPT